jgi:hypothetical protein
MRHLNAMGKNRMARRMSCKPWEVVMRAEHLSNKDAEPQSTHGGIHFESAGVHVKFAPGTKLPPGVKLYDVLSPMQRGVVEATAHYKALGDVLAGFNQHVGAALSDTELASMLDFLIAKPRKKGETAGEKLARLLLQQFIVIPRYIEEPQQQPAAPPV